MVFPIQKVRHPDGRNEVVRVFDKELRRDFSTDNPWEFEERIVWLEDIGLLDFVRVATVRNAHSRRGKLLVESEEGAIDVVGYSKLASHTPPDPETGGFTRRIFFLREEDSRLNMNCAPFGSIDPTTVLPGIAGQPPKPKEGGYPYYLRRA